MPGLIKHPKLTADGRKAAFPDLGHFGKVGNSPLRWIGIMRSHSPWLSGCNRSANQPSLHRIRFLLEQSRSATPQAAPLC